MSNSRAKVEALLLQLLEYKRDSDDTVATHVSKRQKL